MAPCPTGTAACMALPRKRSRRAVSAMESAPAAASAEYSPSEWPATQATWDFRLTPLASSTRITASDIAISAGCAFCVSVSVSAGPSPDHLRQRLAQRIVDLGEHGARLGKRLGQRLAHTHGLATLARKQKCDGHVYGTLR